MEWRGGKGWVLLDHTLLNFNKKGTTKTDVALLKVLWQPRQKFWPKILTPYFFYSNLNLHFLRLCCENIFKFVCIVSEKIGK